MDVDQIHLSTRRLPGRARSLAATGALAVAAIFALRAAFINAGGTDAIVTAMPDDAFYYVVLAKNFAVTGQWSFDGTAPATGFHPLWAYALAALYRAAPEIGLGGLFLISSLVGVTCFALAAFLMIKRLTAQYGRAAAGAVLIVLFGGMVTRLPSMGVEAPLVLLAAAIAAYLSFSRSNSKWLGLAAGAGFFGMLARSDFGLLPLALFAVALLRKENRLVTGALLLGAIAGLAFITAETELISGSLLQNSARMKAYWSSLAGHSLLAPITLVMNVFCLNAALLPPLSGVALMTALGGTSFWAVRKMRLDGAMPAAGALAIAGYVLLYGRNAQSLQPWYGASFAIPAMLLFAPAFPALAQKKLAWAAAGLVMIGGLIGSALPIWPHQRVAKEAGLYLAAHPEIAPVGAMNAGLIAYFAGRPVVNLDGLVNDAVYPFAVTGTLADYVRARGIAYILDYAAMFDDPAFARRGGYGDGRLRRCMSPKMQFGGEAWKGTALTLYRIDAACLLTPSPPS